MVGLTGIGMDLHLSELLNQNWRSGMQDKLHQFDVVGKRVFKRHKDKATPAGDIRSQVLPKFGIEDLEQASPPVHPCSLHAYLELLGMKLPTYPQHAWGFNDPRTAGRIVVASQKPDKDRANPDAPDQVGRARANPADAANQAGRANPADAAVPATEVEAGSSSDSDDDSTSSTSSSSDSEPEEGSRTTGTTADLADLPGWMKLQKKLRRLLAFGQGRECLQRAAKSLGILRQVSVPAPGQTRYIVYSNDILRKSVLDLGLRYRAMLNIRKEFLRRIEAAKRRVGEETKTRTAATAGSCGSSGPGPSGRITAPLPEISVHATLSTLVSVGPKPKPKPRATTKAKSRAQAQPSPAGPASKRTRLDPRVAKAMKESKERIIILDGLAARMASGVNVLHVLLVMDFFRPFFEGALVVQRSNSIVFEVQRPASTTLRTIVDCGCDFCPPASIERTAKP